MDEQFIRKILHLEVDAKRKGLTRGLIAHKMNLSGATISNYFSGHTDPDSDTKEELIEILENSISGDINVR